MPEQQGSSTPPCVSVVIPLYNKAPYVLAALRSVQAQTFQDFEIVVIDDGSTDRSAELVEAIDEPRLRLLRQANAGAGAARNAGIHAARGHWVAFLDADDAWRPERLARQLTVLERHPDLVWAAGAYTTMRPGDPRERVGRPLDEAWFIAPDVLGDALVLLAAGRQIWTGTVMAERRVLLGLGGFEPTLRNGQDLDLWVRVALRHPSLAYVRAPLARYQSGVHGSVSSRKFEEGSAANLQIARRLLAMGNETDASRAAYLRRIARRLAVNQAKIQFVAGRLREARAALEGLEQLGLGPAPGWLRVGSRLPIGPTAFASRLGIRLRQRWRGARSRARAARLQQ